MVQISRITTQKKSKHRYNIFLNDGKKEFYGFSVDEDILIKEHLHKGMELDQAKIDSLQDKDATHKLYTLSLHYLSYRMRSEKELLDYLKKKEVPLETVSEVMDRLKEEGLLDDKAFAVALINTRILTTSKGPLLIKKELIEKGVDRLIIEEVIPLYTFDKQYEKVLKLIEKKSNFNEKKSYKEQLDRLKLNLMQKGFSNDVIQEALASASPEKDNEAEYQAVVFQGEKALQKYSRKSQGFELKHKVKSALYRKRFSAELIDRFIEEYVENE
ncbi:recombination regulator RecX [Saliterribacillus persicus]|uniref:Regulatory protein RecX n=1 Tax=Saliterribacillus persicus TaxID=930114 RepID=A0A368X4C1_9BACI|nr:recombination regulator RecX [Saliterribacillus persicus]RCW62840.1 regulatory protein [Saliterribacillus persicus]